MSVLDRAIVYIENRIVKNNELLKNGEVDNGLSETIEKLNNLINSNEIIAFYWLSSVAGYNDIYALDKLHEVIVYKGSTIEYAKDFFNTMYEQQISMIKRSEISDYIVIDYNKFIIDLEIDGIHNFNNEYLILNTHI